MFFFCLRIKMQYDHIVATISQLKVTRPSFFFGGGGVPSYFEALLLTHRIDNIFINLQYNIKFLVIGQKCHVVIMPRPFEV